MPPNPLNPVLFALLGDPITLAKLLSVVGLALDVIGVVILLLHDLRGREALLAMLLESAASKEEKERLKKLALGPVVYKIYREGQPKAAARRAIATTRWGFGLVLAGFALQLAGTILS